MLNRFINTLKYIFFTAVLCIYMTACGNADKQSAAEQSGTEIIQEPLDVTPMPMPEHEPAPGSTPEHEPEEETDFDGLDAYLSILTEYERAWEDETYTVEEWQDAAGVFMTLTDAKFWLGTKAKDYTLYYNMSDLTGDGTEELIIGIQGEEGIAPCFLYTRDGERIHITDSHTGSDLVDIPTILYENEHLVA